MWIYNCCCSGSSNWRNLEEADVRPDYGEDGRVGIPPRIPADTCGRLRDDRAHQWRSREVASYEWLRAKPDSDARHERVSAHQATRTASVAGGYYLGGTFKEILAAEAMKAGTRTVEDPGPEWRGPDCGRKTQWSQRLEHAAAVAEECARRRHHCKVVLVNPASAYKTGGNFTSGGPHGLEESLCTCSTLFESLLVHASQPGTSLPSTVSAEELTRIMSRSGGIRCYIPEHAVLLSPSVEFFRGFCSQGYPFLEQPFRLGGVVSVALPNHNPRLIIEPVNTFTAEHTEQSVLEATFRALLAAAAEYAHGDVLVMPDVGLGCYEGDAKFIGSTFGRVVRTCCPSSFREIHVTGDPTFMQAAAAFARCS
eukprot:NODE_9284_length_1434_cov_11.169090.p1 GENE.NODE_9284_length_1434_cov_11.169090~~NODE_9284_length_1434_cov_11.169090.p1  ORF type:complete len:405 (-),score=88.05 NODE_9284_length_1434_cov_11.169090:220-1320(-)